MSSLRRYIINWLLAAMFFVVAGSTSLNTDPRAAAYFSWFAAFLAAIAVVVNWWPEQAQRRTKR